MRRWYYFTKWLRGLYIVVRVNRSIYYENRILKGWRKREQNIWLELTTSQPNLTPTTQQKWNYFSASCCLIVCSHTTRIGFFFLQSKTHTHSTGEQFTNLFYFNLSLLWFNFISMAYPSMFEFIKIPINVDYTLKQNLNFLFIYINFIHLPLSIYVIIHSLILFNDFIFIWNWMEYFP